MGEASTCLQVASKLRGLSPSIRLLALFESVSAQTLTEALYCGVDACWPAAVPRWVIAKAVQRWARSCPSSGRAYGATSKSTSTSTSTSEGWKLVARGWVVQGPGGRTVDLTAAERALLRALNNAQHHQLSHSVLWQHIQPGDSSVCNELAARRLSVLVSRLRQKFTAASLALPVRSVHGKGYELSAALYEP